MGIGPSTKETTLHNFRDPLLDVVSADEDLDLMGILIVGTPQDQQDKVLVGTRAAVWAEGMRADGVIICGCHPGDCHYTSGNFYARRRMTLLFSMLDYIGVENGRTRVEWVSAAEGAKFSQTMHEFVDKITSLGKNVRLEDLRCRN